MIRDWTGYRLSDSCAYPFGGRLAHSAHADAGGPCRIDCGLLKHDDLKWFIRAGFAVGQIERRKEKLAGGIVLGRIFSARGACSGPRSSTHIHAGTCGHRRYLALETGRLLDVSPSGARARGLPP